jgi:uncharacterized protein involved in propanediol utilization
MFDQQYYDGVKKGIEFGSQWTKIIKKLKKLEKSVKEQSYTQDLAAVLLPKIQNLVLEMKIGLEELTYLLDNEQDLNREKEFDNMLTKLLKYESAYKKMKRINRFKWYL